MNNADLQSEFLQWLESGQPGDLWHRIYSDDLPNVPSLAIFARRDDDGACRDYMLVGMPQQEGHAQIWLDQLGPSTDLKAGRMDPGSPVWLQPVRFQRGNPYDGWNGFSTTALIEILKHHLASFVVPPFKYVEKMPGIRWSRIAISKLEEAGNVLRQRLKWRKHVNVFGPPGSPSGYDSLGNPSVE